jgi:aminoglycoside phosphotransferase (APT) family kinase protein
MKASFQQHIPSIIKKEFQETPKQVTHMPTGLRNEVFSVTLSEQEVMVRISNNSLSIAGSAKFIPVFRKQGISVPEILAEDYSKELGPFCYQILKKIPGTDIDYVIKELSKPQLKAIAKEIARIITTLRKLPTSGRFGWVGVDESQTQSTWTETMRFLSDKALTRCAQTKVMDDALKNMLKDIIIQNKDYFSSVKSEFYYDDLSSKNVIINNGKFAGLVDLDGVMYGDPLESIGRIKASWYGALHGDYYTKAVMDELKLDESAHRMVCMYALFNRIYWLCEHGIEFNVNTSNKIDWKEVEKDKKVIHRLSKEYKQ